MHIYTHTQYARLAASNTIITAHDASFLLMKIKNWLELLVHERITECTFDLCSHEWFTGGHGTVLTDTLSRRWMMPSRLGKEQYAVNSRISSSTYWGTSFSCREQSLVALFQRGSNKHGI